MSMSIEKKMENVAKQIEGLKNDPNKSGLVYDIEQWIGGLEYFYNNLVPRQGGDPSKTFYQPKKAPKVHQIAYFNLRRGYPKELFGGHWCYVLKNYKSKYLVVPTTSVKKDSTDLNPNFEIDIEVDGFMNELVTRLQVTDIRTLDVQRLYDKKGFYEVTTDREIVLDKLSKIIAFDK